MNTYNYYVPAWITRRSPPTEHAAPLGPPTEGVPHPPPDGTTPLGPPVEAHPVDPPASPLYPARPEEDSGRRDAQRRGAARLGAKDAPAEETKSRHERKCAVCSHPEREAIEEAFLHWQSPTEIATEHDLTDFSAIYRHAHATGLFDRRDNNLRFALGNFIERVNEIQIVTADAIVHAICAYTRISKNGEWIEPPRQITVTHVRAAEPPPGEPDIMQIPTPKAIKALSSRLEDVAKGRPRRA